MNTSDKNNHEREEELPRLSLQPVEGEDYVVEAGRWVFTRTYHLKRGYCCGSGCRHCPYDGRGETRRVATCPQCARAFGCHAQQCWCAEVKVSLEALAELRRSYASCVCPECLSQMAEKHRE